MPLKNKAHKFTFKTNTAGFFFFLKKLECWRWIMVYVQIFVWNLPTLV